MFANRLFQPLRIGSIEIKNRIGMAPMGNMGMVDKENAFTQRAVDYFVERARGGTGLIVTGYMEVDNEIEVSEDGITMNPNTDPYRFKLTAGELTERVQAYGCKIFAQLAMGYGRVGYPEWLKGRPVAPSEVPCFWNPSVTARELSTEEVEYLVGKMADAALVVKQAGFDGIEVHAAHEGYLIDQFMLSFFNKRTDKYGGSFENRMRLPREVIDAIRAKVGKDFPVIMRFSVKSFLKDFNQGGLPGEDFEEKGRTVEEALIVAKELEKMGYDGLDVDCGTYEGWYWAHPPGYMPHGLYLPYVDRLKEVVNIPILMAGRMEEPELAAKVVSDGTIDMVMLGRGLLADADWAQKVKQGKLTEIRPCLGCHDGCLAREDMGRPISCAVNAACGREELYRLYPALVKKKVMVVGGGLAGMETARVAALRGHKVSLFERQEKLGGHIIEASIPDFKEDERLLIRWYEQELNKLGVELNLGVSVDRKTIEKLSPDELVLATGSREKMIPVEGSDAKNMVTACQVLLDPTLAGDKVTIVGGGLVGCEVALWLANQGRTVTLVEFMDDLMGSIYVSYANKQMLLDMLKLKNVRILTGSCAKRYENGEASLLCKDEMVCIPCDTLVMAVGYTPERSL